MAWSWLLWPTLYMVALFGISAVPGNMAGEEPEGVGASFAWVPPSLQNALHLPAYGLLAWLWLRGLHPRLSLGTALATGVLLTIGYGLLDEWHQAYVPGRYPSTTDVLADALGAGLAAGLYGWRYARPAV